jgi:CRP-like cAMP-binding protein
VIRFGADGRRSVLSLASPGDVVGGLPGRRFDYTIETVTAAELCVTDAAGLEDALARVPGLRRQILTNAADQLTRVQDLTWLRARLSSRERVIAFLVMAARVLPVAAQTDGSVIVAIPLPRRDWADLSGTAVETVSRVMSALAAEGEVAAIDRTHYRIASLARLRGMARLAAPERGPSLDGSPA